MLSTSWQSTGGVVCDRPSMPVSGCPGPKNGEPRYKAHPIYYNLVCRDSQSISFGKNTIAPRFVF